jgi:hypothetical protein
MLHKLIKMFHPVVFDVHEVILDVPSGDVQMLRCCKHFKHMLQVFNSEVAFSLRCVKWIFECSMQH